MRALWFLGNIETTLLLHLYLKEVDEVVFLDHGGWPREVYDYLKEAQDFFGFTARVVDLEVEGWPERDDPCEYLRREVLIPHLKAGGFHLVYQPLRGSRPVEGAVEERFPLEGMDDYQLWSEIRRHSLPFCHLYLRGYRRVDCFPRRRREEREDFTEKLESMGYL